MITAVRGIGKLAAAVILTLGLSGCGGDNGTGPDYTYSGGTVKIGNQTWMKKNLDRATSDSKCYDDDPANCNTYGRLYTWSDALTACPSGWHLPSDAEWDVLVDFVDSNASMKLKATSGWNENCDGTDAYGFSALPGGYGEFIGLGFIGDFDGAGNYGGWWSATDYDAYYAPYRSMSCGFESVGRSGSVKTYLFSVRCVQD